ncbi:hypothetical protein [Streptomyces sp. MNU89]|uniref:hypothetical protein n=1 Tax=Streptomyces sp. MNU89 TaxID=2560025 RepID=UPI001E2ABA88|nr:hypothetical protein [Streptomyces sp. MNU89]MCC9740358.1 hypothetical protein [Streptomyces sp. MNU89]
MGDPHPDRTTREPDRNGRRHTRRTGPAVVAKDLDLTETAVRDRVKQAEVDAGETGRPGQQ